MTAVCTTLSNVLYMKNRQLINHSENIWCNVKLVIFGVKLFLNFAFLDILEITYVTLNLASRIYFCRFSMENLAANSANVSRSELWL